MNPSQYSQYREPFPSQFFAKAAAVMQLSRTDRLLDVACGTAALAFGFAPYVGSLTGLDPDGPALDFVRAEASGNGIDIELIHASMEDIPDDLVPFDVVTIGRAHAQLPRDATLARLNALVSARGKILICGTMTDDNVSGPWASAFRSVGQRWGRRKASLNEIEFMRGSPFGSESRFAFRWARPVSIDLLLRALTFSGTTPERLGSRKDQFLAELRSAITPHSVRGMLREVIITTGFTFSRSSSSAP